MGFQLDKRAAVITVAGLATALMYAGFIGSAQINVANDAAHCSGGDPALYRKLAALPEAQLQPSGAIRYKRAACQSGWPFTTKWTGYTNCFITLSSRADVVAFYDRRLRADGWNSGGATVNPASGYAGYGRGDGSNIGADISTRSLGLVTQVEYVLSTSGENTNPCWL